MDYVDILDILKTNYSSDLKDYNNTRMYLSLMRTVHSNTNISRDDLSKLMDQINFIFKSDLEEIFGKPMVVIGMYIVFASLVCIVAMGGDFFHSLSSKKQWFPSKLFTLNAFYLTMIAVAMKLPVDLTGSMPSDVDQVAKLGSLSFMCIMMVNFLPSIAEMHNKELWTNIIALIVLVVTLVVNVCIQIYTGVVSSLGTDPSYFDLIEISRGGKAKKFYVFLGNTFPVIAGIYVGLLLLLLIIYVSSALAILGSKQIIESKYQQGHVTASQDFKKDSILTAEKLQQHLSNYWIMVGSGSPQFIIACSATTTASAVICLLATIIHFISMAFTIDDIREKLKQEQKYESDYKWSTLVILIVQFIGVLVGTVAPLCRCFASLSFKIDFKVIWNHLNVFKVESFWTQKLSDWKHERLSFRLRRLNRKEAIKSLKTMFLNFCILLQVLVVVSCKIIALNPFFIMICFYCLKWLLLVAFRSPGDGNENLEYSKYVLLLKNDMKLGESTLKRLLKSLNVLIRKSEKKHPTNLMNLIKEKSTKGFQGAKIFDNDNHQDCWSLAVVTLATIAVTLRKIRKKEVKKLMKGVREGLEYVSLVEENLNTSDEHVRIQEVALRLWQEVDVSHKWLGIKLKDIASEAEKTDCKEDLTRHIVKLLLEKAEGKISEVEGKKDDESPNGDSEFKSICVNSMSRIAAAIDADGIESLKNSFDELISSRIADILASCLTNLPKVIAMKCHTNVIEKRESSVRAAAKVLVETKQIINYLHDHHVPRKNDGPYDVSGP